MSKPLLKHILDGARPSHQQWLSLFDTDTQLLRQCAGVLRHRYLSNVQLIARHYLQAPEVSQIHADLAKGYRLMICTSQEQSGSLEFPLYDERQCLLTPEHSLPADMPTPPKLILLPVSNIKEVTLPQAHPQPVWILEPDAATSESALLAAACLLRIAFPGSTIAISGHSSHYQDICNLTLIPEDEKSCPSVLDDEAYRIMRSKYIPSTHWQQAPFSPAQRNSYEASAVLSLRYFCRIVSDEDTRVDLIRFCNHCLYSNAPRYPKNFSRFLEDEDSRPILAP